MGRSIHMANCPNGKGNQKEEKLPKNGGSKPSFHEDIHCIFIPYRVIHGYLCKDISNCGYLLQVFGNPEKNFF